MAQADRDKQFAAVVDVTDKIHQSEGELDADQGTRSSKSRPNTPSSRTPPAEIVGMSRASRPRPTARQGSGRQRREPGRDFDRLGRRAEGGQQAGRFFAARTIWAGSKYCGSTSIVRSARFYRITSVARFKKATKSPPTSSPAKPPGKLPAARGGRPVRRLLAACLSKSRTPTSTP